MSETREMRMGVSELTTLDDQIRCVAREIELRKIVYPKRVDNGDMTEFAMVVEIARMEAVLRTLKGLQRYTGV